MTQETTTEEIVATNEELLACVDPEEDQSLTAGITLPTYEDTTDQSVMTSVRDVFRGFSFDANEDFGKRFSDIEQLALYITSSMSDIQSTRRRAEAGAMLQRAATMARFWCMGKVIDKALQEGKYGTSACRKLAISIKKSEPYLYKIRAVADKLSVTDCYLLGMRGCNSTTLIELAQVRDDATRKGIITAFVNSITDTSNGLIVERARKALVNAINVNKKTSFAELSTSDPTAGGSDILVTDSYQRVMDGLRKWQRIVKKLTSEEVIEEFCTTAADFSINENVPEAERHLAEVKAEAEHTKEMVQTAINNLNDSLRELNSLAGVEVIYNEGPDI